jgi:hypothetical protein
VDLQAIVRDDLGRSDDGNSTHSTFSSALRLEIEVSGILENILIIPRSRARHAESIYESLMTCRSPGLAAT